MAKKPTQATEATDTPHEAPHDGPRADGPAAVTLAGEEVYDVFNAVLDAVQAWTTDEDVLANDEAHRRLLRHLDALRIMAAAVIAADAPLVRAHLDDARAAEEWRHDRWMARSRPAPAPDDTATDGATRVQP